MTTFTTDDRVNATAHEVGMGFKDGALKTAVHVKSNREAFVLTKDEAYPEWISEIVTARNEAGDCEAIGKLNRKWLHSKLDEFLDSM
jgi:ABC-type transporter Mla maintaining outer membrane lipid asymmetry ATPase subunit MlaF